MTPLYPPPQALAHEVSRTFLGSVNDIDIYRLDERNRRFSFLLVSLIGASSYMMERPAKDYEGTLLHNFYISPNSGDLLLTVEVVNFCKAYRNLTE